MKVLSNYSMRPNRLERHLKQQHPTLVLKTKEFFSSNAEALRRVRLDKSGSYHTGVSQHLKTSFEIAFIIAKQQKPHTIGGDAEQKMKSISLSNDTVKRRIDDIAADINCEESTDIVNCVLLIVYVRYIGEEILYSQSAAGTTSKIYLIQYQILLKKIIWIRLCTDGAPALIGVGSGLATKLKEKKPSMVSTHCVIHRQALASKTLPQKLRQTLDLAIRIVNYIKISALNSRLFTLLCDDLDSDQKVLLFHT
ncbi:unnamed protein product [Acanthoscelides obtectus]|uniref:SCAN domain-containing protein 3 n=1 Tax=Acanthoscelides obtectus TaxID=200917 RepID=A0A9P0PGP8_ACAOB|nr:unnamed protein product [Acanthoscelides obtectus]CAK1625582.1 SCAN domain-containing protein 3 [Acanthoscelides obtectus]